MRTALRRHWLFSLLLAGGVTLRVLATMAYHPAMLYTDTARYLRNAEDLSTSTYNPLGYPLFVKALLGLHDLTWYAVANHVMGLATAGLVYAVLLRRGVRPWLAALAAAPVLVDAFVVEVEELVLSEAMFHLLLVAGLAVLVWRRRPGPAEAALAGLLLGLAPWVRAVGLPVVVPAVLYLLVVARPWRRRVGLAALALVVFAGMFAAQSVWWHHTVTKKSQLTTARLFYARVAPFARCAELDIPDYARPLCPPGEADHRPPTDVFFWRGPAAAYEPPPGTDKNAVILQFDAQVIRHQPVAYTRAWLGDFAHGFAWTKSDIEKRPVKPWHFQDSFNYFRQDPADVAALVDRHGGSGPGVDRGLAHGLRTYQLSGGYTPGPPLALALVLALAAGVADVLRRGRARAWPGLGAAAAAWALTGAGLMLLASLFEFSWRYQLPEVILLPAAGAMALTALFRRPETSAAGGADVCGQGDQARAGDEPGQGGAVDDDAESAFARRYADPHLGPVVVLVAAYNEADGIGAVLDELPRDVAGRHADVLVVDDGSSDSTAEVAADHGAFVCPAPVNRGQGAALRLGYRLARRFGAEVIVTTDADGQYDPAQMSTVVEPVVRGEADFVTGSRALGSQETTDRVRHLGVVVFARLVSLLTGQRVTDTSFGMRAMRADVPAALTLAQPQYQSSELLIGVLTRGYRVVEVPATMRARAEGQSKKGSNLVYGTRYARVVLGTWLRERRAVVTRLVRYTAGSVVAGVLTETTFFVLYSAHLTGPRTASVLAWAAGAVPNYLMNRWWAWGRRGRASVRGELLPYVVVVVTTAALSTWVTGQVDHLAAAATTHPGLRVLLVNGAFVGTYGVMFVVKYVLFDRLLRPRAAVAHT